MQNATTRKILERTWYKQNFLYFMVFEEKSDYHARYSKYWCVYALLISFLKQFKKLFFHLIEHALNSRLSIFVPKKVLVKNYIIYIKKIVHGQDLISRAKPGRSASIVNNRKSIIDYWAFWPYNWDLIHSLVTFIINNIMGVWMTDIIYNIFR